MLILANSIWALTGCERYKYNRILEEVYDKDQAAREWTYGITSISADEYIMYSTEMSRVDSLNRIIVFDILDKEGWPANLSEKANQAIWIVIDHSDADNQKKYLPLVKQKSEEGVLNKVDYAILNDRVLMKDGKPQIYGTQIKLSAVYIGEDLTTQFFLWPVENPEALDSLRKTIGLPPIKDYLHASGQSLGQEIIWDKNKTISDF
jgi:hypothetical protein